MKNLKKLEIKELLNILGKGGSGCHMNGDSAYCWSDCDCAFGRACEMSDDGNAGQCVTVGGGGSGGGNPCFNGNNNCTEQPY